MRWLYEHSLPVIALLYLSLVTGAQVPRIKRIALHPVESPMTRPEIPTTAYVPLPDIRLPEPAAPKVLMPLADYRITSAFGWRKHPVTRKADFHNGIDLAARSQTVFSIMDGTVVATGYQRNLGNYVRIDHGTVQSIYGHLSQISVNTLQTVTAGSPIGITGRTGRATGEHLHFSIQRNGIYINPWKFLKGLIELTPNKH